MLEINSKWAIGADNDNIILYRKSTPKKEGKEVAWRVEGYFGNLRNVLTALLDREVKETHLESFKVVTSKLDEIYDLIKNLPSITVADIKSKE